MEKFKQLRFNTKLTLIGSIMFLIFILNLGLSSIISVHRFMPPILSSLFTMGLYILVFVSFIVSLVFMIKKRDRVNLITFLISSLTSLLLLVTILYVLYEFAKTMSNL